MVGMNKVILIGRITKDIDLRYMQNSENRIARFTLAVDRRSKDKDEADFISCVAWNKTAELLDKYCSRGSKIGIVGRIQTGSFTASNGEKRYTTDVIADEIEFLDTKKAEQKQDKDEWMPVPDDVDDAGLPFRGDLNG